jgi:hypothetical protein
LAEDAPTFSADKMSRRETVREALEALLDAQVVGPGHSGTTQSAGDGDRAGALGGLI